MSSSTLSEERWWLKNGYPAILQVPAAFAARREPLVGGLDLIIDRAKHFASPKIGLSAHQTRLSSMTDRFTMHVDETTQLTPRWTVSSPPSVLVNSWVCTSCEVNPNRNTFDWEKTRASVDFAYLLSPLQLSFYIFHTRVLILQLSFYIFNARLCKIPRENEDP
jgi:hypothetical protein